METLSYTCIVNFPIDPTKESLSLGPNLTVKCLEKELSGNTEHLLELLAQTSYKVQVIPVAKA